MYERVYVPCKKRQTLSKNRQKNPNFLINFLKLKNKKYIVTYLAKSIKVTYFNVCQIHFYQNKFFAVQTSLKYSVCFYFLFKILNISSTLRPDCRNFRYGKSIFFLKQGIFIFISSTILSDISVLYYSFFYIKQSFRTLVRKSHSSINSDQHDRL